MILNSYQNQNTKIMELETKLRMQKMKYDRKSKQLEEFYINEIDKLKMKISVFEKRESFSAYAKENISNSSGKLSKFMDSNEYSKNVIWKNFNLIFLNI